MVISTARQIRREMPGYDFSVDDACIRMTDGPLVIQQQRAFTMALVVGLRKAHVASPSTIFWPNPAVYGLHCKSQVDPVTTDTDSRTSHRTRDRPTPPSSRPRRTRPTDPRGSDTRESKIALAPATAPTAAMTTGTAGPRARKYTLPSMTAGLAAGRVQITADHISTRRGWTSGNLRPGKGELERRALQEVSPAGGHFPDQLVQLFHERQRRKPRTRRHHQLRFSTIEVHPIPSKAPHLRCSVPRPKTGFCKNQIASR